MCIRSCFMSVGLFIVSAGCLLYVGGCGGDKAANRPKTYPVSGRVSYKGEPVGNADVTFVGQDHERSAFGRTDSQGRFKLTTFSPNDGAIPGKYVVVVKKVEETFAEPMPDVTDESYDPDAVNRAAAAPPPKNLIPMKYGNPKTSDLFVVITEGKNDEVLLELID